ncbi:MAG: hypothetical protein JO312_06880 [Hyphomicrobiales bacterium]|nr:hypothetical protein [Hyphomicrobiales bacterium]
MPYINLATEDALSEAIGLKLISTFIPSFDVNLKLGKKGNGLLKAKLSAYCEMARRAPFLLITDLDAATCAPALIRNWLGNIASPDGFLFRVAVREVEGWLLADQVSVERLLGNRVNAPRDPDNIRHPKGHLLHLARRAPREVRRDLLAEEGAIASQGLGYNQRLCEYVNASWNPSHAAERSESLRRVIRRLERLTAT